MINRTTKTILATLPLVMAIFFCPLPSQCAQQSSTTAPSSNPENIRYEDQFTGASLALRITAAAADCISSECTVVIPGNETGNTNTGYPGTIPDNIVIRDERSGGMGTFIANPNNCKKTAGFLNVQIGLPIPAGQIGGIPTQCVGSYISVQPTAGMDGWGLNTVNTCVSGRNCWGYEADVVPVAGAAQAIGVDAVAAGSGQALNMPALRCYTPGNINPVGGWRTCLQVQGVTDTAIMFTRKDTGLRIIQAITASDVPQTVVTNGQRAVVPVSQLYVGGYISVDSGPSQEDVKLSITGCRRTTTITGVFKKNHSNPTALTEYGAQRIWDAANYVASRQSPYLWGSIQKYNEANTPNRLGFGVIDSLGAPRLS